MVTRDVKYWVVIPAAGMGRRMRSKTPKQYLKINDKTVIEHTVSLFSTHPLIEQVVVVLHEADTQWSTINIENPWKIVTTVGGETRAQSVMQGLIYLQSMAAAKDWILVHDAVRPCLSSTLLNHFMHIVDGHRLGGLLAVPIMDTVKKVDTDHGVRQTISREGLWIAQTPQMFRYGFLFDALQRAVALGKPVTDESSAIELAGEHPLVVPGDWCNIKITQPEDLVRAKKHLEEQK